MELWTMLTAQEPAGQAITALITFVFLLGVLDALRALGWSWRESTLLRHARSRLTSLEGPLPTDPPAALAALGLPAHSLAGHRAARTLELRRGGAGHREVLRRISLEGIGRHGALARFIATILTVLGLIGTVVGMSFAMFRMSGAFHQVDDVQALGQLTRALGGTLEGMKTAFACTLIGLLGAILLSALNHLVRRRQSSVVQDLEEFVIGDLIPRIEKIDPEADQAARAFASVLTEASEQVAALGARFETAAERYESGSQKLAEAVAGFATGTQSAIGELAELLRDLRGSIGQFAANESASMKVLSELRDTVQTLSRTLTTEMDRIETFGKQSHELLGNHLGEMQKESRNSQDLLETLTQYDASFKQLVERTAHQLEGSFKTMLEEVNRLYKDDVREHVEQTRRTLDEVVQQHATQLKAFSSLLVELHVDSRGAATNGHLHAA